MKRDEAVMEIWEALLGTITVDDTMSEENIERNLACGREVATEIMDAAFPDYDWRLAVGINKVCPECEGSGAEPFRKYVYRDGLVPCPTCNDLGSVKKEEKK